MVGNRKKIWRSSSSRLAWLLTGVPLLPSAAHAGGAPLPMGGSVAAGSAKITSGYDASGGGVTTINQSTSRAVVNWQSFDVGAGNNVNFVQPNAQAATLNRVTGSATSTIAGSITSNGAVYLVNPNGIAITSTGSVNTGGGFVASTLDITDKDFMSGKLNFTGTGASNAVTNAGHISAGQGAYVALLGGSVSNSGTINVPLGKVGLGSGESIALDLNGNGFMQVAVPTALVNGSNALIDNAGSISASGGYVQLQAAVVKDAVRNVINMSGSINADSATGDAGSIHLIGGADTSNMAGTVNVSGTLSAQATGSTGDGGFVETSGEHVNLNGSTVTTASAQGKTGSWLIDPTDFTVAASGGDETGAALSAALSGNSIIIQSSQGAQGTLGNININDAVSWSNAHSLTLDAANNINIAAAITDSGTGAVHLITGDTAGNQVSTGGALNFALGASGFTGSLSFTGSGNTLSINSAPVTLITSMSQLSAITGTGNYALATSLNAQGNTYTGPLLATLSATLNGLGNTIANLSINDTTDANVGLFGTISATGSVANLGLAGGTVRANGAAAVSTNVGALAGTNSGTIANSFSSASVIATGSAGSNGAAGAAPPPNYKSSIAGGAGGNGATLVVGGLVGINAGTITASYTSGPVTGTSGNGGTGGVGGYGQYTAFGEPGGTGGYAGALTLGGLAGSNTGTLSQDYASGAATGTSGNGGTGGAGSNGYAVVGASGNLSGGAGGNAAPAGGLTLGGLVGNNSGTLSQDHASGAVLGTSGTSTGGTGGTGGYLNGNGTATGGQGGSGDQGANTSTIAGGLVGINAGSVSQSYATGAVTAIGEQTKGGAGGTGGYTTANGSTGGVGGGALAGQVEVGGLAGYNFNGASISQSYASGAVSGIGGSGTGGTGGTGGPGLVGGGTGGTGGTGGAGDVYAGGLVGFNLASSVTNTYATGAVIGTGGTSLGGTGGSGGYALGGGSRGAGGTGGTGTGALLRVGGLVGSFHGTNSSGTLFSINNSYASGAVSGTAPRFVGGAGGAGGAGNGAVGGTYANPFIAQVDVQFSAYDKQLSAYNADSTKYANPGPAPTNTDINGVFVNIGGFAGFNSGNMVNDSWDSYSTGQSAAIGGGFTAGQGPSSGIYVGVFVPPTITSTQVSSQPGQTALPGAFAASSYAGLTTPTWFFLPGARPILSFQADAALTPVNGVVTVTTPLQLAYINADGNTLSQSYLLGGNIDLSQGIAATAIVGQPGTYAGVFANGVSFANWTPLGTLASPFSGSFNGGGFTISGLNINSTAPKYVGLFGYSTGTLSNLTISGSVTGTGNAVGALVGWQQGGSISGVTSSVTVSGAAGTGGLVGSARSTSLTNDSVSGSVSGTSSVGGLAGEQVGGSWSGDSATGSVTGTNSFVGGLVGVMYGGALSGTASGTVSGSSDVGGLVGYEQGTGSSITNSTTSGARVSGSSNVGGLVGYSEGSVSGSSSGDTVGGTSILGGLVGRQAYGSISSSSATGGVTGANVAGSEFIGGLVGYQDGGASITGSTSSGTVYSQTTTTALFVGGLVGDAAGSISGSASSSFVGQTSAPGIPANIAYVGGLVGLQAGASISQSKASGGVSGDFATGGLVGYTVSGSIDQSYASGAVSGTGSYQGGLIGFINSGSLTNVYATGAVHGSALYAGGLVGYQYGGSIAQAYATGAVSGGVLNGGLIGYQEAGSLTNGAWDSQTTGQTNGTGVTLGGATFTAQGLTTLNAQDFNASATNYPGFDFSTIWTTPTQAGQNGAVTAAYPTLKNRP